MERVDQFDLSHGEADLEPLLAEHNQLAKDNNLMMLRIQANIDRMAELHKQIEERVSLYGWAAYPLHLTTTHKEP